MDDVRPEPTDEPLLEASTVGGRDGEAMTTPDPAAEWGVQDADPGDAAAVGGQPPRRRRAGRRWRPFAVGALGALIGATAFAAALPVYRVVAQNRPGIETVSQSASDVANTSPAVKVFKDLAPSVVLVTNQSSPQGFTGAQQTAWGSGVIFSSSGYIVTNDHVVQGASQVTVTLSDGSSYPAHIVGGDPSTDLAVIKISVPAGTTLQPATFADSKDVVPGQIAIAIGNPLGPQFEQSVTEGIVGAIRPMLYGLNGSSPRVTQLIQTDAPINPGNSGGALANVDGQVIGITTLKVPQTGEYGVPATGLGFAIPSNTVSGIVDQLMQNGYVKRSYIGVVIQPSPGNALPTQPQTLTITQVEAGSPAEAAGLQPGDVLTSWKGQPLLNYYQLVQDINQTQPGETVAIGVDRNGSPVNASVTLGQVPQAQEMSAQPAPSGPSGGGGGGGGGGSSSGVLPFPFPFGP